MDSFPMDFGPSVSYRPDAEIVKGDITEPGAIDNELESACEVAVSPQQEHHLAYTNDSTIFIRDTSTGQIVHSMEMGENVSDVDFSPNGQHLLSTDGNGGAIIWNSETGVKEASLEGHSKGKYVAHGRFSPDGQLAVTGSGDKSARIWEASTGKQLRTLNFDYPVNDVAFTNDNRYILVGIRTESSGISFWNVDTGELLLTIDAHRDFILNVAFSPGGDIFVTRSYDNTLRVWNATNLSARFFSNAPSGPPQEIWKTIQQKLNLTVDKNDEVIPLWPDGFSEQDGWAGDPMETPDIPRDVGDEGMRVRGRPLHYRVIKRYPM